MHGQGIWSLVFTLECWGWAGCGTSKGEIDILCEYFMQKLENAFLRGRGAARNIFQETSSPFLMFLPHPSFVTNCGILVRFKAAQAGVVRFELNFVLINFCWTVSARHNPALMFKMLH